MQTSGENTIPVKRRIVIGATILPLFFGFAAFMNILKDPHAEAIRSLDMVRFIAVGACWGVSVVGLVLLITSKLRQS